METRECVCSCDNVRFEADGAPLFRMLCHCTICQRFNSSAYADVNVYSPESVKMPDANTVSFDTYKRPPNVQRGKCAKCGNPAIETFNSLFMPNLVIVPTSMFADKTLLPNPSAHVFYDTRITDIDDDLPKYENFLPSQLAFFKFLIRAKRTRK